MTFSTHSIQLGSLLLVAAIIVPVIQRLFLSPVSKVPGPWLAKATGLVKKYHDFTGTAPQWILELHEQYGDEVAIAPDIVDAWTPADAALVHNFKKPFLKSSFYGRFGNGTENVFSTQNPEKHRHWRKLLSGALSESGLRTVMPQVESKVAMAMSQMSNEMERRGAVDVMRWYMALTTDVIGELSFGESFKTLETGEKSQYQQDLEHLNTGAGIRQVFSFLRFLPPSMIPISAIRETYELVHRLKEYAETSIQRYSNMVDDAADPSEVKQTLFTKVMKAKDNETMSLDDVRNNAQIYIIAGSDTTAMTLTFTTWELCRPKHAAIKAKLMAELNTVEGELDDEKLRHLPYLGYVIDEALRLHSAVPGALPRVVPNGGATIGKEGHFLPAGTICQTSAYSLHRNADVFEDPLAFKPERWENPTRQMKDAYMPFGGGSRVCIGLHLAYIELRMMLALFFKTYPNATLSELEGFTDKDMEAQMFFLMNPKGHRCLIDAH